MCAGVRQLQGTRADPAAADLLPAGAPTEHYLGPHRHYHPVDDKANETSNGDGKALTQLFAKQKDEKASFAIIALTDGESVVCDPRSP